MSRWIAYPSLKSSSRSTRISISSSAVPLQRKSLVDACQQHRPQIPCHGTMAGLFAGCRRSRRWCTAAGASAVTTARSDALGASTHTTVPLPHTMTVHTYSFSANEQYPVQVSRPGLAPWMPLQNAPRPLPSVISVVAPKKRCGIALSRRTSKPSWSSPPVNTVKAHPLTPSAPFADTSNVEFSRMGLPEPTVMSASTIS